MLRRALYQFKIHLRFGLDTTNSSIFVCCLVEFLSEIPIYMSQYFSLLLLVIVNEDVCSLILPNIIIKGFPALFPRSFFFVLFFVVGACLLLLFLLCCYCLCPFYFSLLFKLLSYYLSQCNKLTMVDRFTQVFLLILRESNKSQ